MAARIAPLSLSSARAFIVGSRLRKKIVSWLPGIVSTCGFHHNLRERRLLVLLACIFRYLFWKVDFGRDKKKSVLVCGVIPFSGSLLEPKTAT